MNKLVECVPNFSEGRRKEVIEAILDGAKSVKGVTVLDCESDQNHNRMVLTFVGPPKETKEAALAASAKAVELIDLTTHKGEHPRMGAVDVVPFVPLKDVSMEECVALANSFATEFSSKFSIPVFLYESAATRENRRNLAAVREGQFEGLRELIGRDPEKDPDYGPKKIHPTAGATAVGARPVLIAYNVDLDTTDISVSKKIAKMVRERDGGLPAVKALGFELKDKKQTQVSMNLTDFKRTPVHVAFEEVSKLAHENGVKVVDSEIVGLVPLEVLALASDHYLKLKGFREEQIMENRLLEIATHQAIGEGKKSYLGMTLDEFATTVSSEAPVPAGGSVSAYSGALSASLVAMVCRVTIGKKGYESARQRAEFILSKAISLQSILLYLVNRDAMAYTLVSSALKMAKDTEEEKAERKSKLIEALKVATQVPVETLERSNEVRLLAEEITTIGNKNARSDAQSAVELSKAAMRGALFNIYANLEGLKDDAGFASDIGRRIGPLAQNI